MYEGLENIKFKLTENEVKYLGNVEFELYRINLANQFKGKKRFFKITPLLSFLFY